MQALDHAAIGIVVLDSDGRIVHGNPRLAEITGRAPAELARLGWADIAHPDDWSWQRALAAEVAAGRRAELQLEQRMLRPDGTEAHLSLTLSPLPEAAGPRALAIVQDVTAQRLGEEALRGSELRFRRVIEKLPTAAYTCDADGLITYFNEQAVALWGRAPRLHDPSDRWCGSFKLFACDGTPIAHEQCWMARSLHERRDFDGEEIVIERPDGSRVAALAHASPLHDDDGRMVGCVNILVDISERKRTEARLQESERRFEQFMQHLPGLAWIKHLDGRYLFVNDAAAHAFQRARDEVYGRRDDEIFPAPTSIEFRENDEKVISSGKGIETIETLEHADGIQHHSLVSKFPIPGPDGRPELIGGVAIDITDRIAVESALRETEARFRDMADHAPVQIWVLGPGGCEFVNRECLRFVGCSLDEVRGDGWQRFIHPEDADAYLREYTSGVAQQRPFEALMRCRRADGEYRWLRSTGVPRAGADGTPISYVGCSVDMTEIKQSEQALQVADRRKDEFLATLAHELRNPLAPIRNSLELLRGSNPDPQLYRMLERQVDQLVRLVDDLLDVSRITRGHIALRRERVALADVVREALDTAQPALEAGRHQLVLDLPDAPLWLDADPLRLSQVFVNLLNNAAKYTQDGGRIEVSARAAGGEVTVRVRDDGIGIAPEVLSRIFEPFTQVDRDSGRAQGGLGIGLALVSQLTGLHGGRVEAHSDGPGRGSEFVVALPLADAAAASARPLRPEIRRVPAVRTPPSAPILVVDDNRDGAESLALLLGTRGLRAEVALDGPTALELARRIQPAIVLLDLGMPGMDGFEVARRLRAEPACRNAVLVALTGWNQPDVRERCAQAGFDHHLVKPVQLEMLEQLLELPPGAAAS